MNYKKLLSLAAIFSATTLSCFASEYNYCDGGGIYSNVTIPVCVPKNNANEIVSESETGIIPVADKQLDLKQLKVGVAKKVNILQLVEVGSAGIADAAKNGNITKIHYVEQENDKIYIPILFIPIYAKSVTTKVYGE